MSRRHVDPGRPELGNALRSALHTAVESVEPGADGLDQIHAKIAAKQSERHRIAWRPTLTPGTSRPWWRMLLPPDRKSVV